MCFHPCLYYVVTIVNAFFCFCLTNFLYLKPTLFSSCCICIFIHTITTFLNPKPFVFNNWFKSKKTLSSFSCVYSLVTIVNALFYFYLGDLLLFETHLEINLHSYSHLHHLHLKPSCFLQLVWTLKKSCCHHFHVYFMFTLIFLYPFLKQLCFGLLLFIFLCEMVPLKPSQNFKFGLFFHKNVFAPSIGG